MRLPDQCGPVIINCNCGGTGAPPTAVGTCDCSFFFFTCSVSRDDCIAPATPHCTNYGVFCRCDCH